MHLFVALAKAKLKVQKSWNMFATQDNHPIAMVETNRDGITQAIYVAILGKNTWL